MYTLTSLYSMMLCLVRSIVEVFVMYPLHPLQYSVTPRGHGSNLYCTICHTCNRTRTYTGYPDNICYDAYLGHTRNVLFRGHIQPSAYTITILDSLHATVQYNQRGRLAPSTILLPSISHPCGVLSVVHTNLVCFTSLNIFVARQ